jgi:predicted nucleic acid-binding protein
MKIFIDASLLIYLNAPMPDEQAQLVETFWKNILTEHKGYTNILVLDEVVYVSKKKYRVPAEETLAFLDYAVLPYLKLLPLGPELYPYFKHYLEKYHLKPSDAIHAATINKYRLDAIATEDKDFDKTQIKRLCL